MPLIVAPVVTFPGSKVRRAGCSHRRLAAVTELASGTRSVVSSRRSRSTRRASSYLEDPTVPPAPRPYSQSDSLPTGSAQGLLSAPLRDER